jgi:hypothetical protein
MPVISRIRRVEDRTDKVMSSVVAFTMTKSDRPELDLDAEAQAALDEARAMPQGPERIAAMKKAGIRRNAADSHGIVYAKRGETHENLVELSTASGVSK